MFHLGRVSFYLTFFHLIVSSRFTVTLLSLGFQYDTRNTASVIGQIIELLSVVVLIRQVTNQVESTLFRTTGKWEMSLGSVPFPLGDVWCFSATTRRCVLGVLHTVSEGN